MARFVNFDELINFMIQDRERHRETKYTHSATIILDTGQCFLCG